MLACARRLADGTRRGSQTASTCGIEGEDQRRHRRRLARAPQHPSRHASGLCEQPGPTPSSSTISRVTRTFHPHTVLSQAKKVRKPVVMRLPGGLSIALAD